MYYSVSWSKYEEICSPRVEEFCFITDNTYTSHEVCHHCLFAKWVHELLKLWSEYHLPFSLCLPSIQIYHICQSFLILRTFASSLKIDMKNHITLFLSFSPSFVCWFGGLEEKWLNNMWNLRLDSKMENSNTKPLYNTSWHLLSFFLCFFFFFLYFASLLEYFWCWSWPKSGAGAKDGDSSVKFFWLSNICSHCKNVSEVLQLIEFSPFYLWLQEIISVSIMQLLLQISLFSGDFYVQHRHHTR